jgi:GNAT superfamily N-acetyltransferase
MTVSHKKNAPITVAVVSRPEQWRQFLALPHRIYAADPAWIAPLDFMKREQLSPANHFFEHARWRAWLALRDGQPVGRITAQIDELHLQRHGDAAGYFGMLEAEQDDAIFSALFGAAEEWLRAEGMRQVRGPFNLHINDEVGLLVEGFSTPPYVLMGHALPWYGAAVEAQGYTGVKDVLAYHVRPDFQAPRVMERLASRASDRVKVRTVRRKQLREDACVMLDIFNDAWQDNWGFVPLAEAEWVETVSTLTKIMPDDYIQIAEYDGEPVAFIVALPNLNEAARDLRGRLLPFGWAKLLWRLKVRHPRTARVPLMGVRQSFQHSRLGPTLAFMVIDAVRKALHARGVRDVEMGWILEDNDGMRSIIETIGGEAYKRYRIYEKEL